MLEQLRKRDALQNYIEEDSRFIAWNKTVVL